MGLIAAALIGTGGVLGATGAGLEGQATEQALKYNIKATRQQQLLEAEEMRTEAERIRSENVVAIAKSGVRRAGSPMEVLAGNAAETARKIALGKQASEAQVDLMQYQVKQSRIATGISVASQLLGAGGQATSAYMTS